MKRSIIILLVLIAFFAIPTLAKPMVMVTNTIFDENNLFCLNECEDELLNKILGQFLANEIGNVYIGGGIYEFNGLPKIVEEILKKYLPDFIFELIKNMSKGEYLVEIWKDFQTGKITIEITPMK